MMAEYELATDLVRCAALMFLCEKPLHGYAIIEALQERLGRTVSPAIVYPFLAQMLAARYLTSKTEKVGSKTRTVYSMTPKGRKFSQTVFSRLSQIVSTAIEPNILHCTNCGCKLYEAGHMEKIAGRQITFCCVHCSRAYKRERA